MASRGYYSGYSSSVANSSSDAKHAHNGRAASATARKKRSVKPAITSVSEVTQLNDNFRNIIWTGANLQVTSMTIPKGGEIGLEVHPHTDQVLLVAKGTALVRLSTTKHAQPVESVVSSGDFIMVPSGTWHNVMNAGKAKLKIVSMYAPPHHTPHASYGGATNLTY